MMNLLYIAYIREDSSAKGFLNKVLGQCYTFRKEFNHVYLYISRKTEAVLYKIEEKGPKEIKSFGYSKTFVYKGKSNKIKGYLRYRYFIKCLKRILDSMQIDVLYYRNSYPTRDLRRLMKYSDSIKTIEIVTYPYEDEWKKTMPYFEYLFMWKYGQEKVNKLADVIVGISAEKDLKVDEKFILINNGIQVDSVKVKKQDKKNYVNLLSIANVALWHGYDRIIKGLHEYYKTNPEKEIYYHFVGEGPELTNLKKLTKELNLEKYVIFHGTKTGEDLDKVVDECDIALGSLGNHRKGLYADSALKNREYCARGIPFVIASEDQDFPETFPFVYRIPKDDTPVDINQVIKWYESLIKEHPNYSMEMRKYAEQNLSWDAKMKPVIEKIKELAREKERKTNT